MPPSVAIADPPLNLRDWVRQADGLSATELIDALQHDQLRRWRQGERVPAETYLQLLATHPDTAASEQALDLIYGEFLLRQERGETLSLNEYEWRFPGHAAELRVLVDLEHELAEGDAETVEEPAPGLIPIPGYTAIEEVGRGANGVVYRAIQHGLNRTVALKVIRAPDPETRARFKIEAEAVARLQHPHIVQIYEVGEADVGPYMAIEFVAGGTLADRLAGNPLPATQAASLIETLAQAVHYAHQRGILHRDLKPWNVLLESAECGVRSAELVGSHSALRVPHSALLPKVADFGLAKRLEDIDSAQTRTGAILGTPCYMAPEQAAGRSRDVGVATDVYALGAILYEALTGRPPFRAETALETMEAVRSHEPVAPRRLQAKLPRDLETICLKCLRKDPAQRYASADALADDLRRWQAGEPIVARRVGWTGRTVRWMRRYPALTATLFLALIAIATVAGMSYFRVVRERDRYRTANDESVAHLYKSLVGEARALRLARAPGYRADALARLQQALALDTPERDPFVLRNEAIACLGDFVGLEPAVWDDFPPYIYVVDIAIHPAGNEVALAMTDHTVSIRDRATGATIAKLNGHPARVFAVVYGTDGNLLASADDGGTIKVWARQSDGWAGTTTFTIAASGVPNHVHAVSIALSPDGQRLYACSRSTAKIHVWDLATGTERDGFELPKQEPFYRMALSRDGKWLAGALDPSAGDGIVIWDVASRQIRQRVAPGLGTIHDVVFSPMGKHMACACGNGVAIFDLPDFRPRLFIRGDAPEGVAFSPDDRLLAIPATEFGLVRLWDVRANRESAVLKHAREPHSVAFTPDGSTLFGVGAALINVWKLHGTGGKIVLSGHDGGVHDVRFTPEGRLFSVGADGTIKIADPRTGQRIGQLIERKEFDRLDLTADGRTMMTSDIYGTIRTWDTSEPTRSRPLRTYKHELGPNIFCIGMSPDGMFLAVAGERGLVVWRRDAEAGTKIGEADKVHTFDFCPDSRRLLWGYSGGERIFLRDLVANTQTTLPLDDRQSVPVPMLPDGKRMLRFNDARELTMLEVDTGHKLATLGKVEFGGQSAFFMGHAASLTTDGAWLALQAPAIPVWDVERACPLFTLPPNQTVPTCLAWGPNREFLAVGSRDGELVVWNVRALRAQLQALGLDW